MGVKYGMMQRLRPCHCQENWIFKQILPMLWITYVFHYHCIIQ